MKKLTFAMAFVSISLVSLLLVIGYSFNNKTKKYRELENNLKESAMLYKQYTDLSTDNVISSDELIQNGYLNDLVTNDKKDECVGYVKIDINNNYEAFIKCSEYTTLNY